MQRPGKILMHCGAKPQKCKAEPDLRGEAAVTGASGCQSGCV